MSDEASETPVDNSAVMCGWLIVMTSVMLLGAIFAVLTILKDHYSRGLLAG